MLQRNKLVPGFDLQFGWGLFCVEFACSTCVCVGSLQVLGLPPTDMDVRLIGNCCCFLWLQQQSDVDSEPWRQSSLTVSLLPGTTNKITHVTHFQIQQPVNIVALVQLHCREENIWNDMISECTSHKGFGVVWLSYCFCSANTLDWMPVSVWPSLHSWHRHNLDISLQKSSWRVQSLLYLSQADWQGILGNEEGKQTKMN